jgi:hypothetical protein
MTEAMDDPEEDTPPFILGAGFSLVRNLFLLNLSERELLMDGHDAIH